MTTRYDWPFYRPIMFDGQALQALKAWQATLPKDKSQGDEFGPPAWAFAQAEPVWGYVVRQCDCYVFLFQERQGIASGFVLNAAWNKVELILGDGVESLAAALSVATMRPAPTRKNGRREV
jgi:hypothetical protein